MFYNCICYDNIYIYIYISTIPHQLRLFTVTEYNVSDLNGEIHHYTRCRNARLVEGDITRVHVINSRVTHSVVFKKFHPKK